MVEYKSYFVVVGAPLCGKTTLIKMLSDVTDNISCEEFKKELQHYDGTQVGGIKSATVEIQNLAELKDVLHWLEGTTHHLASLKKEMPNIYAIYINSYDDVFMDRLRDIVASDLKNRTQQSECDYKYSRLVMEYFAAPPIIVKEIHQADCFKNVIEIGYFDELMASSAIKKLTPYIENLKVPKDTLFSFGGNAKSN